MVYGAFQMAKRLRSSHQRARAPATAETREAARRKLYCAVKQREQEKRNQGGIIAQGLVWIA